MTTVKEQIAISAPAMAFSFQTTNMGDAAGTFKAIQVDSNEYCMPWGGSVIGISAVSNGAYSTGTITVRATVAGTAVTTYTTSLSSTAQKNYVRIPAGAVRFAANALLGADWTKSGTVDPTTNDVIVTLFVQFDGVL